MNVISTRACNLYITYMCVPFPHEMYIVLLTSFMHNIISTVTCNESYLTLRIYQHVHVCTVNPLTLGHTCMCALESRVIHKYMISFLKDGIHVH